MKSVSRTKERRITFDLLVLILTLSLCCFTCVLYAQKNSDKRLQQKLTALVAGFCNPTFGIALGLLRAEIKVEK